MRASITNPTKTQVSIQIRSTFALAPGKSDTVGFAAEQLEALRAQGCNVTVLEDAPPAGSKKALAAEAAAPPKPAAAVKPASRGPGTTNPNPLAPS